MNTDKSRIDKSSSTRLNNRRGYAATSVNIRGGDAADIRSGMILPGNYAVQERLPVYSGEADLYTCLDVKDNLLIAKIYRRKDAVKKNILETLSALPDSPYIAGIYDYGEINGYPFTIIPYFRNGSLAGKKYSAGEIKSMVLPCVNRGLEYLHSHRILHKDIKPSNLMLSDDMSRILITDFGISSLAGDGQSIVVTGTGMSPEYSAPETFSNIFLEESDYYSLGISLYELYTGSTPFSSHDGLTDDEIIASASVQSIPFSADFPEDLKNLIKGLTYKDLSKRRDKSNPNRRWTCREVELWLKNEPQTVPGEGIFSNASLTGSRNSDGYKPESAYRFSKPYIFPGRDGTSCHYDTLPGLADSLASNWDQGKKHVGRGFLSKFFAEDGNQQLASLVMDCEDDKTTDLAYFKLIFNLLSETGEPYFCWKNVIYQDLASLSGYLSCRLFGLKTEALKSFEEEFGDLVNALEFWYENKNQTENLEIVRKIRETYKAGSFCLTAKIIILSSFLDPHFTVRIGDRDYSSPSEFRGEYIKLKSAGDGSSERFVRENREMIRGYGSCLNPEISGAFTEALEDLAKIESEEKREKEKEKEKEKERNSETQRAEDSAKAKNRYTEDAEYTDNSEYADKSENDSYGDSYINGSGKNNRSSYNGGRSGRASGWTHGTGSWRKNDDRITVFQDCMNNGECIVFGRFFIKQQDRYDPLTWKVLSVDEDNRRALLITEFGIDSMPYQIKENSPDTWEHSHVRSWLNDMFLSTAFYPDELSVITFSEIESYRYVVTAEDIRNLLHDGLRTTVSSIFNIFGEYGTITDRLTNGMEDLIREKGNIGSCETTVLTDRIFILSAKEAKKYMPDKKSRRCKPTQFAVTTGNQIRSGYWTDWWLRGSRNNLGGTAFDTEINRLNLNINGITSINGDGFEISGSNTYGACVDKSGHICGDEKDSSEISCVRDDILIRPAMWVDINSEIFDRIERYRPQEDDRTRGRNGYYEL